MAWLAAFQAAVTSGPTQHRPETVLGSPQVGIKHSQSTFISINIPSPVK